MSGKKSRQSKAAKGDTAKAAKRQRALNAESRRDSDVSNKVFVAESEVHGLGMFAAVDLKAGEVIGRLSGMPTHSDGIYVLWITDDLGLELTSDIKYINHGTPANCELTDIEAVTLRKIKAGDELFHDYGW